MNGSLALLYSSSTSFGCHEIGHGTAIETRDPRETIYSKRATFRATFQVSLSLSSLPFDKVETSFKKKQGPRISILGSKKRTSFSAHGIQLTCSDVRREGDRLPTCGRISSFRPIIRPHHENWYCFRVSTVIDRGKRISQTRHDLNGEKGRERQIEFVSFVFFGERRSAQHPSEHVDARGNSSSFFVGRPFARRCSSASAYIAYTVFSSRGETSPQR